MAFSEDEFFGTSSSINKNQAEYNILSALRYECDCEIFLLQVFDIRLVKEAYGDILNYIKNEYRANELNLFCMDAHKQFSKIEIGKLSAGLENEVFLFNKAQEISSKNTYVLIKSKSIFSLYYNGKLDQRFKHFFISKETLLELESKKYEIKDLKLVFSIYHENRKFNSAEYIKFDSMKNPKVLDSVSEQDLRNDLFLFIKDNTKLRLIPESCTSLMRDEESVDISLFDSDNNAAIIEVKFVIGKGFFYSNSKKEKYKFDRFKDGYKQLNRYCNHIYDDKLYTVRAAYLYMFYAHSDKKEEIEAKADAYYKGFIDETDSKETEKLRQQYSGTILDNIVDVEL